MQLRKVVVDKTFHEATGQLDQSWELEIE